MSHFPSKTTEILLCGDGHEDGSKRFCVDEDTGFTEIQKLIDGVWQPTSFEVGTDSLWVGHSVGISGLGHHLATESSDGHLHFHAHSEFEDGLTTKDTQIIYSDYYAPYIPVQPDDSNEFTGKIYEYSHLSTSHSLIEKFYIKTGNTPASSTIRLQAWEGEDDTGNLFFDQKYPASQFPINSEVPMILKGKVEYLDNVNYFFRMSSDEDFSLKTNSSGDWTLALTFSRVREDNLLQTKEWVDGDSWDEDDYLIKNRKIYVCNQTGIQTGTFEDNSDKWNLLDASDTGAETDPIFTAWDKSSGISITESQISDLNHFNGMFGALSGTTQNRVPYGNASGGLIDSPNLTYSDSALRISNGGIYLDRPSADSYLVFSRGGVQQGQIRGADGSIDITASGGSPVHFSVDTSTGVTTIDEVDTSNIGNSGGILKLNSDATGIVELFGDADVLDDENGKMLYVWRRAPEGDDYIRFYTDSTKKAFIQASNELTLEAQQLNLVGNILASGNLTAEKIYLADSGSNYMGWQSGDGIFQFSGGLDVGNTLFANDISGGNWTGATIDATDYIETPIIRNTDGDTVTIEDNLQVDGNTNINEGGLLLSRTANNPYIHFTYAGNGIGQIRAGVDYINFTNLSADSNYLRVPTVDDQPFEIMPNAAGDVELFSGADVANNENSKIFKVWRRAPEGNDYIRFYISASRNAYIHASNKLTLQAQVPFTINSVTDDIIFKVGDNAGAKKVYFKDSEGNVVASIDSNGNLNCNELETGNGAIIAKGMEIGEGLTILADGAHITGNVDITNSLTVGNDVIVTDDVHVYGDISGRNIITEKAVVFQDNSTQEEASERHFSQGHTPTAIYNNNWYGASSENMSERDMHFSPDGLEMYIIGLADSGVGDCSIWQYSLTIPWDLSTVGSPTIESIETYGSNQVGIFISPNGRKLWTVCTANDTVIEYSMAPWNISTLSWVQAKDISGQETSPSAIFWSANGNRLFVAGDADNDIVAFSVTNEWDISGISWFENFGTDINAPTGLHFSSDGRRMYVMDGSAEDDIHEFHLSLPWRISSARLVNLFNVCAENASPQGIFLTPDNSKIFMVGTGTPDGVYGYDLGIEVDGAIISNNGPVQVGSMTTTQRDALVAANGMIIYNTTTNVFNFYENGSWVTK